MDSLAKDMARQLVMNTHHNTRQKERPNKHADRVTWNNHFECDIAVRCALFSYDDPPLLQNHDVGAVGLSDITEFNLRIAGNLKYGKLEIEWNELELAKKKDLALEGLYRGACLSPRDNSRINCPELTIKSLIGDSEYNLLNMLKKIMEHDSTGNRRVKELYLFRHPQVDSQFRTTDESSEVVKAFMHEHQLLCTFCIVETVKGVVDAYYNVPMPPPVPKSAWPVDQSRCEEMAAISYNACNTCSAKTNRQDLKRCGKCLEIWYYSLECQKKDWPEHRKFCNKKTFDFAPLAPVAPDEFIGCPAAVPGFIRTPALWRQISYLSEPDSQFTDYHFDAQPGHTDAIMISYPPGARLVFLVAQRTAMASGSVPAIYQMLAILEFEEDLGVRDFTHARYRCQFEREYAVKVTLEGRWAAGKFDPPTAQELKEEEQFLRQRWASVDKYPKRRPLPQTFYRTVLYLGDKRSFGLPGFLVTQQPIWSRDGPLILTRWPPAALLVEGLLLLRELSGLRHIKRDVTIFTFSFHRDNLAFGNASIPQHVELVQAPPVSPGNPPLLVAKHQGFTGLKMRAAAAASGSHDETLALIRDLEGIAPKYHPQLIPVFCAGLNPAHIPGILAQFDVMGWSSIRSEIVQGHLCIRGISELGILNAIVPGAFVDIWNHVWPWVEFLDEYEESLSDEDLLDAKTRYSGFLSSMRSLNGSRAAEKMIDSTPDVYVVIGRAWRHFIDGEYEGGLTNVSYFLGLWFKNTHWDSAAFDELILGAGEPVQTLLQLSSHTSHMFFQTLALQSHRKRSFISLGWSARALCQSPLETAGIELKGLSALVDQISSCSPIWLLEALRAGLFDIVFTSQHRDAISSCLTGLLEDVIPSATVYHSVLVEVQTSLAEVCDRDAAAISGDPAFLALWESLVALVKSRLPILDKYNTGALVAPRVCDNLECIRIRPKFELNCCSGCLTMHYCSKICQGVGWRSGHRLTCGDLFSRRKRGLHISPRNRSFLGALMYHEYMTRQAEVAQKQLLFAEQHPDELPCTMFDFTAGTCEIEIWQLERFAPGFELDAVRITRSAGRLQLMRVVDADQTGCLMWRFPLRVECVEVIPGPEGTGALPADQNATGLEGAQ
ncbi:hypothetical protein C8R45DRAFT_1212913 [Mycena sanguinolenta]|nr:hypothetical protein C8R45DRAFT_1212913 [Mycena sanguinolenta]